ncbi:transcription termination/antitermination protein NusA [Candidatus Uhrbacteria bacterium]|nr:transcription termination/antitermination protein NusA [Candidatus Uhrbacteria bacterium]
MSSVIEQAIRQICDEKGLEYEAVLETIEAALAAAYRKDYGDRYHNLEAEFDPETGGVRVFDVKTVVEDISDEEREAMEKREAEKAAAREAARAIGDNRPEPEDVVDEDGPKFNPKTDIMISQAKILKLGAKIGDVLRTELPTPGEFGRMAAMTAKQVITQKLREAEREIVFSEYKGQEGEVLVGTVQRREGRIVLVDIGRTAGILKPEDQMQSERYQSGDRIKVFVREVSLGTRGPQILLSRTHEGLVRRLFEIEIPEVADGLVVIKAIAREAGARTKIAVTSTDASVDPIGACIGQRGTRIQTIISELSGEKIDVIEWSDDHKEFIRHALAPAKIVSITLHEDERSATAMVATDQLSLAIGRGGQNVRLAAKLTGWKLNIQEEGANPPAPMNGGDLSEEEAKSEDTPPLMEGSGVVEPKAE